MAKCPKIDSKEWKYAESKLGTDEDTLLYIFDFLGQREPSVKETNRLAKGETLTPYYNQAVWDVEQKEGLTKGRRPVHYTDKFGIDQVKFEEVRTQIKQPKEASERMDSLSTRHPDFTFEMKLSKDGQAWEILAKDTRVGKRSDSNGELQIDQSPKKPDPVITMTEGNEYVRDGVVYPSYEDAVNADDHRTETQEPFNRELFNRIKERLLKTLPYVENIVEDTELPVSARLMPGGTEIRINPEMVAKDSLGHEFGHILIDLVGGMSNPLIKNGREQLRGTKFESDVIALYPELVGLEDDRLDKEVLTRALGQKVTELFEKEEQRTKFENWMVRLFRRIRNMLGIEISVVQRLAETMLNSNPLATRETATAKEIRRGLYIQRELGMNYYQDSKNSQEDGKIVQNLIKKEELQKKKALAAIETKISLYSRRSSGQQGERAIETLRNLQKNMQATDPTRSLLHFVKNAMKTTEDINNLYAAALREERKGNPKAFTQRMLDEWRTYLSAYDVLDQYKELLVSTNNQLNLFKTDADAKALGIILGENRELFKSIKNLSLDGKNSFIDAVLPVITKIIEDKNLLKSLYATKGKEITIDFLMPYVTQIETDYREDAWRKYPKLSDAEKAGRDREQYIADYISDNRDEITRKTRELLAKEIEVGNDDISVLARYVVTVLDSPDVISSTLAKIWVTHMDQTRKEIDEARYEFVDRIKALEKQQGRNVTKSDEDFFDFMLERDPTSKNILTQHIVSAIPSKLINDWLDYKEMVWGPNFRIGSENRIAENWEKYEAQEKWLDKWAPINKEAQFNAEYEFMKGLHKEGMITIKQLNRWRSNWKVTDFRAKAKDSVIFEDSPDAILELKLFRNKHFWDHRTLSKYYDDMTGQWKALEKIRASNPNDERIKFYDFIIETIEKADALLPYKKRLGLRLPGMTKDFADRLRSGEGLALAAKRSTGIGLEKQPSDIEKGALDEKGRSALVNEAKEPIYLIPTNYINPVKLTDQFFDVGTLYFGYLSTAMKYRSTAEILPALEMGKYFVENREVTRRDAKGRPFVDALSAKRDRELSKSGKNSMIAAQLSDFFRMSIFGQKKAEEPDIPFLGLEIDRAKMLDSINRYTSVSLLGLNLVAGTANVLLGESLQRIESVAGEYVKWGNLRKATREYYKDFGNIIGDIGERRPYSRVNMLNDRFDTLNEFTGGKLNSSSRFREMMKMGTMFFLSHAGEHYMQTRFMMAMLDNIEAKDKDGNVLGTMLDMYRVDPKTKNLVVQGPKGEEVANWDSLKETELKNHLKRILSRMHGEYSDEGMSAMQLTALGRMAILFRKFLVPGFNRRWQKRHYNNLSDSYTEGMYLTFGKFLGRLVKDTISLKFELLSSKSSLTPMEKANIKRTLGEITMFFACIVLAGFAAKFKNEDPEHERTWSFLAYQAYRLRSEFSFYLLPTSAMQILRSPAASTSFVQSIIKFSGQLFDPIISGTGQFDIYDRGPWKGEPKIYKTMTDMVPGFKQYFRIRDIENQLGWWQSTSMNMR